MADNIIVLEDPAWRHVIDREKLTAYRCGGKWMHIFPVEDYERVCDLAYQAVESGVCREAKCSTRMRCLLDPHQTGALCLYGEADDMAFHRACTAFMLEHDLIQRTKRGTYYNISFKLNELTRAGVYGEDFRKADKLILSHLRDLATGEWLADR